MLTYFLKLLLFFEMLNFYYSKNHIIFLKIDKMLNNTNIILFLNLMLMMKNSECLIVSRRNRNCRTVIDIEDQWFKMV